MDYIGTYIDGRGGALDRVHMEGFPMHGGGIDSQHGYMKQSQQGDLGEELEGRIYNYPEFNI